MLAQSLNPLVAPDVAADRRCHRRLTGIVAVDRGRDRGPSTGWPTLSLPFAAAAESDPAPAADYCR